MFAPRTGSRLVAQVARLDLAAFPSRPTPSSSALLAQARCLATLSPSCNRSSPTPSLSSSLLRSSILARSRPDTWTIASAAPRRSFHSSRPAAVIRDSYFQDDRRRSNARDGGRGPTPKGGWERLKRAFWDAVLRFERLPANVVLALVVAPNVLVYLAWQGADFFKSNRLQRFLTANFLLSEAHVQAGKWWTLLTYSFSHMNVLHLGINMFCLVSIGRGVMGVIGNTRFLGLYLLAGLAGGVASFVSRKFIDGKLPLCGSSGSFAGLLALYGAAFPSHQVLVFFVLPLQLRYAISAWAAYDLFAEVYFKNRRAIDGSCHLGGMATGLLLFLFLRRKYRW